MKSRISRVGMRAVWKLLSWGRRKLSLRRGLPRGMAASRLRFARRRFLRMEGLEERAMLSVSGTKSVGPTGDYPSITAVIAAIQASPGPNKGPLDGPLVMELQPTYVSSVETFPINLSNLDGISSTNTVTIRPASGATGRSISSADTEATLKLDAVSYVTIDGRPGGTGTSKELTIENTDVGGVAVQFVSEASNNTIKYTTVKGRNTSATEGVIAFGATAGANGNDNNTIDNCDIRDGAGTPTNAVYAIGATGTAAMNNSGNIISNSNIYNFSAPNNSDATGVLIVGGYTDWTITGNSFFQTA